jgi:hypothetical protein
MVNITGKDSTRSQNAQINKKNFKTSINFKIINGTSRHFTTGNANG